MRDELKNYLAAKGIFSKVYFDPIHLTKFYKEEFGFREGDLPITEEISKKVLTLPMYPMMEKEELGYVIKTIRQCMGGKNE